MDISIEQAIQFGTINSFSLYPVEGCDAGPILDFDDFTYTVLLKDMHLVGDFWLRTVENDEIPEDSICLVYNKDTLDGLLDYTSPENIVPLLSNAHLAEYTASPLPSLRLISKTPLLEILTKQFDTIKSHESLEIRTPEACSLKTKPYVKELLEKNPDFSGRVRVCDVHSGDMPCNEPCCHSEFAWSKDGTVLFYMSAGSDLITGVWFLPNIRTM